MSSNKLYKLIEKYNLTNPIKVILLLLILFLIYRIFIESQNYVIPNLYPNTKIHEGFQQALLGNGNIYGNVLILNRSTYLFINGCSLLIKPGGLNQ